MPSHIKHMDKMHKISVNSNSSMSQLSFGISFILKNSILKNRKIHCLVWNCPLQVSAGLWLLHHVLFAYMLGRFSSVL